MAQVIEGALLGGNISKTVIILNEYEASALVDVLLMAGHERSAASLIDLYFAFAVPCEAYDNIVKSA